MDGLIEILKLAGAAVSLAAGIVKLLSVLSESRGNKKDR